MNTKTPTPETDTFFRQDALKNLEKYPAAAFARDLERRLAIARDALGKYRGQIANDGKSGYAEESLTQTAPKS